jgi:hypothetical protein
MDKPKPQLISERRHVIFAAGTAPPNEVRLAVSLNRFETEENKGLTNYYVDVLQYGKLSVVKRRYKDFEALHKRVHDELSIYDYSLPHLPQKRWFQTKRWLNR